MKCGMLQSVKRDILRPAPHGAGGLKCRFSAGINRTMSESRPARGGWVEILRGKVSWTATRWFRPARGGWVEIRPLYAESLGTAESRPARGGWVEINLRHPRHYLQRRPAPHGAGGLKSIRSCKLAGNLLQSRPARGGWVEMSNKITHLSASVSRPARGGWVEMPSVGASSPQKMSRPARGGWVEIPHLTLVMLLRMGSAPHGAGGLKYQGRTMSQAIPGGPAPHGAGGLKSCLPASL